MSVNQAVLDKLRKVLNLASGRGATQGEIEAAMARAKEIAMKHGVDLASVDMTDPKAKSKTMDITTDSDLKSNIAFERKYHTWIFHILTVLFGVRFITNRKQQGSRHRLTTIWVIGEVTDVAIVKVLFSWLEELYPKSYREAVNAHLIAEDNAANAHGYYRGLSIGILETNKKEEEKIAATIDGQKWAMVVRDKKQAIDTQVAKEFPELITRTHRVRAANEEAIGLGYQRGKSINLNQVGAGRAAKGQIQ